ncbi:MAG: DNA adenine methylase [Methanobrevibacter sp.]|jgi:adenine-specific DNA-methyltransferase|nr:DNA adenine methylase [Candidatus Methanoflexus mossambicus]
MRFIGSKLLLLEDIERFLEENIQSNDNHVFCDIFSGSGAVARYFKNQYSVISNDLLYFSYVLQKGTIELNKIPKFSNVEINDKFKSPLIENGSNYESNHNSNLGNIIYFFENTPLNTIQKEYNISNNELFIQNNYTPFNGTDRMYFTAEIGKRIDLIRIIMEKWFNEKIINSDEYFYLLTLLIETVPFYSNISGVYGAYLKHWDKRALKPFKFAEIKVTDNNLENKAYNEDAHTLIKKIKGDILYLDPPYNHRQYPPNYHVLETIAKYDYPEIKGVSGMRDYKTQISKFCRKNEVKDALDDIIENSEFKHIVMSYSTDGILNKEDIKEIFIKHGNEKTFKMAQPIKYRKYKSKQKQSKKDLHELLFFISK